MVEEKIVTLNFRKDLKMAARKRRKKRFGNYLRAFLSKKVSEKKVKISTKLNEKIWRTASGKPMGKFRIKIIKRDDGTVVAETVESV